MKILNWYKNVCQIMYVRFLCGYYSYPCSVLEFWHTSWFDYYGIECWKEQNSIGRRTGISIFYVVQYFFITYCNSLALTPEQKKFEYLNDEV